MSKIYDIITNPNPVLRKISTPVDDASIGNKNFKGFCADMVETMKKKDGLGLAAPQIGKNIRIVVVTLNGKPVCMINPEITKRSWAKEWDEEGCLSVPNYYGQVQRNKKINCIYTTPEGKKVKVQTKEMDARVIQHEIDHLDGILFIDKAEGLHKNNS